MLNIRKWLGTLAACAALALAACGGGGGSNGAASVRLINATLTHSSISLLANGAAAIGATPLDNVSAYVGVDAGSPTLQVNDSTSGSALSTLAPSVAKDAHYVVIAYETGGIVRTTVINEDTAAPAVATASLRVFDAATDAGAIDVYVTDPAVDITTLSSPSFTFTSSTALQASVFQSIAPGTYRVRVTGSGNPSDLRLDIPSVVVTSQEVAAVILTPTIGGTLVNGGALAQQGAFTAGRNTSARVRLAAAVTNGAIVTASAGTTSIGSNVVAPSVGGYVVVPAGAALNVSVNGASIGAPATPLAAGSDSTLLVYGAAATATANLIADDNHLPATSTNLKIRLVNGLTGAATPLTLNAAFAVVASNVAPGTASPYGVVAASTALQLDVFSPASATPIYSTTTSTVPLSLPGNSVFTLFMLGSGTTSPPVIPVLRRDR
ncbi:MAG TPA: DUF4397 domain-containing protein [Caldimonas sp.]|nr:DUF4397 domain-containing protein [Caldimonas sp.]